MKFGDLTAADWWLAFMVMWCTAGIVFWAWWIDSTWRDRVLAWWDREVRRGRR